MRSKILSVLIISALLYTPAIQTQSSAKAATKTSQVQSIEAGNKYAKLAHDAYKQKQFLKAAQYFEKAYQANKIKVYLDNAVVAYESYASELTNEKNYEKAVLYCNKSLSLNPNDKNAKELLSDIYFSRGADYFYTGQLEKAKNDFNSSLKYSTLKDQTDRAKDGIAKIDDAIKKGVVPVPQNQPPADASIPDTLNVLENKIYGNTNSTLSLLGRLKKLETDTLGKTYDSDGLIVRINRLKETILPNTNVVANPPQAQIYDDTYIREIIDQSMGKVTIFGKMPITVYIDDCNVKPYQKFYKDAVIEAMKEWEKATNNVLKFQTIPDPAHADIQIVWQENFEDYPWQPTLKKEDLSAEKQRMKYRKANAAVQLGSVAALLAGGLIGIPVIGGVGAIGNSVAAPLLQYKGMKIEKLSPDVKINTKITEGMTDEAAKIKIKQIALHQIGHAIGIDGHSSDTNDIMYGNFTANGLSDRDINTIREIYKPKNEGSANSD